MTTTASRAGITMRFPVAGYDRDTPESLAEWMRVHYPKAAKKRSTLVAMFRKCDDLDHLTWQLMFLLTEPVGMDTKREQDRQRREFARLLRAAVKGPWEPRFVGRAPEIIKDVIADLESALGPVPANRPARRRPRREWHKLLREVKGLTHRDRELLLTLTSPEQADRSLYS